MSHIKTLAIMTLAASAFATSTMAEVEHGPSGPGTAGTGSATSGNVNIYGHVDARCDITNDPVTLDLGEITNPNGTLDTGAVNGKSTNLTAWCNGAGSVMTIKANQIKLQNAPANTPSGFATAVDYTATATAPGNKVAADGSASNPSPANGVTVGAFTGSIAVALSGASTTGGNSLLMLAGNYQGTTTVTLTPGL